MNAVLSRIGSVLIALTLVAGMAALMWFALGAPLAQWRSAALTGRTTTLADLDRLARSVTNLQSERAQFDDSGQLNLLWSAPETGAATALVQRALSEMAARNGVSLRSISPARASALSQMETAAVRIELEAGLDQLANFLRAVEYHSPALLVDRATLRRLNKPGQALVQPLVFAQIDVSAPLSLPEKDSP